MRRAGRPAGPRPARRTAAARIGAAALLLAAALAACGGEGAPPAPPPPEVIVATARLGTLPDRREYVGQVRALNAVDVRARVRGYLRERLFTEGARVARDEVLFRIDPREYEVALAEARGRLARARAAAEHAEREHARARELREQKVVSASVLDARGAERDAAVAEVASAEAAVAAAELDLSWTIVKAPFGGRIGLALVDVGSLVGESGQDTVLARIVQTDPIHVHFAPPELEGLELTRAAAAGEVPVELRLGDGTPFPARGRVDYVDPTVAPAQGTVGARALVPNEDGALKPGQFVRVVAVLPERRDAVLVPERAVVEEQGGAYVYVVPESRTVEYRRVEAGASHDGWRRIASGLAAGERVVVEGVQKARPGSPVMPREADAGAPSAAASASPARDAPVR